MITPSNWLHALCAQDGAAVLVTVAIVEGSGPRDAGAAMVVTADGQFDTIGGGHLELRACAIARAMLADGTTTTARLQRFPLGPTLGQCCGGVTHLAFEMMDDAALAQMRRVRARLRQGRDSWRLIALDGHAPALAVDAGDGDWFDVLPARDCAIVAGPGRQRYLATPLFAERDHLFLFGAGHVGAAIVRALAELPCRVTWVDERAELFPEHVPANVTIELSDAPQEIADSAPGHALFLVMTHSHALDQDLSETILRRETLNWFGLIGSKTKRMLFEHRLAARGIPAHRIAQMACPIGMSGIDGKAPAVIAASVCAQLLQIWQARQRDNVRAAPPVLHTES